MKFSYSWLCDHLDTKLTPSEIADTLTNIGLELESLTDIRAFFNGNLNWINQNGFGLGDY